jgi:hypothetical protein
VTAAPIPLTYACPDADLGAVVARLVADVAAGRDVLLAWRGSEAYLVVEGVRRASAWAAGDRRDAAAYIGRVFRDVLDATLPACPGHDHPGALRTVPDGVGWHCPATGTLLRSYRL